MQNIKFAKTALAAIVVVTTAVMLIGGLTVIPPFAEAQNVKEVKDKQKNKSWYCFSYGYPDPDNGNTVTATVCEETMEQCQSSTFAFDVVEECHEEKKPPAGALCPSPGEEGTYNQCGNK